MPKKENSYFSTTIEKSMKILALFNQDRIGCTLTEISKLTGINMTSTYRFVNTFIELDILRRDQGTKLIKLGSKAIALGHGFLRGFDLLQMMKPIIDEAYEVYKTTIDASLLDGDSLLIIYRREVGNTLTYRLPTVTRRLHCSALGKAVLAFLSDDKRDALLGKMSWERKTGNTLSDRKSLLAELRRTRERGYSINKEEYLLGLIAIGAPLINVDTKQVVGAICFDMSTAQISVEDMQLKYAEAIIRLAEEVSQVLPIV